MLGTQAPRNTKLTARPVSAATVVVACFISTPLLAETDPPVGYQAGWQVDVRKSGPDLDQQIGEKLARFFAPAAGFDMGSYQAGMASAPEVGVAYDAEGQLNVSSGGQHRVGVKIAWGDAADDGEPNCSLTLTVEDRIVAQWQGPITTDADQRVPQGSIELRSGLHPVQLKVACDAPLDSRLKITLVLKKPSEPELQAANGADIVHKGPDRPIVTADAVDPLALAPPGPAHATRRRSGAEGADAAAVPTPPAVIVLSTSGALSNVPTAPVTIAPPALVTAAAEPAVPEPAIVAPPAEEEQTAVAITAPQAVPLQQLDLTTAAVEPAMLEPATVSPPAEGEQSAQEQVAVVITAPEAVPLQQVDLATIAEPAMLGPATVASPAEQEQAAVAMAASQTVPLQQPHLVTAAVAPAILEPATVASPAEQEQGAQQEATVTMAAPKAVPLQQLDLATAAVEPAMPEPTTVAPPAEQEQATQERAAVAVIAPQAVPPEQPDLTLPRLQPLPSAGIAPMPLATMNELPTVASTDVELAARPPSSTRLAVATPAQAIASMPLAAVKEFPRVAVAQADIGPSARSTSPTRLAGATTAQAIASMPFASVKELPRVAVASIDAEPPARPPSPTRLAGAAPAHAIASIPLATVKKLPTVGVSGGAEPPARPPSSTRLAAATPAQTIASIPLATLKELPSVAIAPVDDESPARLAAVTPAEAVGHVAALVARKFAAIDLATATGSQVAVVAPQSKAVEASSDRPAPQKYPVIDLPFLKHEAQGTTVQAASDAPTRAADGSPAAASSKAAQVASLVPPTQHYPALDLPFLKHGMQATVAQAASPSVAVSSAPKSSEREAATSLSSPPEAAAGPFFLKPATRGVAPREEPEPPKPTTAALAVPRFAEAAPSSASSDAHYDVPQVATIDLTIREQPNTLARRIGFVINGETVTVAAPTTDPDWVRLARGGYVQARFLQPLTVVGKGRPSIAFATQVTGQPNACRPYQMPMVTDGRRTLVNGVICPQPNGTWRFSK